MSFHNLGNGYPNPQSPNLQPGFIPPGTRIIVNSPYLNGMRLPNPVNFITVNNGQDIEGPYTLAYGTTTIPVGQPVPRYAPPLPIYNPGNPPYHNAYIAPVGPQYPPPHNNHNQQQPDLLAALIAQNPGVGLLMQQERELADLIRRYPIVLQDPQTVANLIATGQAMLNTQAVFAPPPHTLQEQLNAIQQSIQQLQQQLQQVQSTYQQQLPPQPQLPPPPANNNVVNGAGSAAQAHNDRLTAFLNFFHSTLTLQYPGLIGFHEGILQTLQHPEFFALLQQNADIRATYDQMLNAFDQHNVDQGIENYLALQTLVDLARQQPVDNQWPSSDNAGALSHHGIMSPPPATTTAVAIPKPNNVLTPEQLAQKPAQQDLYRRAYKELERIYCDEHQVSIPQAAIELLNNAFTAGTLDYQKAKEISAAANVAASKGDFFSITISTTKVIPIHTDTTSSSTIKPNGSVNTQTVTNDLFNLQTVTDTITVIPGPSPLEDVTNYGNQHIAQLKEELNIPENEDLAHYQAQIDRALSDILDKFFGNRSLEKLNNLSPDEEWLVDVLKEKIEEVTQQIRLEIIRANNAERAEILGYAYNINN